MRFRFAAGLILAGLSTSPASSNPFTALFNSAPEQAAAPAPAKDAPAKDECLPQPGKPADGQHWMYRFDGHRKCWFPVAADTVAAKKPVRRSPAKRRRDVDEENRAVLPKGDADARAELLRPARAETPQPAPPAPADKPVEVADAAPVAPVTPAAPAIPTGAAAMVPPPPVLSKPDPSKPDDSNPPQSDVERLFAATPADSDTAAVSVPAATSVVDPIVATGDEQRWWTSPWLGPLLMVLGGLMLLLSWRRSHRRTALVAEGLWPAEWEDRPPLRLDFDLPTDPRERRYAQATPRPAPPRPRQTVEGPRTSMPHAQRKRDAFQEAITALTDLDPGRDRVESGMQRS
jgi:hypothetical protein